MMIIVLLVIRKRRDAINMVFGPSGIKMMTDDDNGHYDDDDDGCDGYL